MARLVRRRELAGRHLARALRRARWGRRGCCGCSSGTASRRPGSSPATRSRPSREETDDGRRRRARDRHPRLLAREPDRDDARAGDRRPRQVHRPRRAASRAAARPATSRRGGSSRPSRTSSCSSTASSTTTASCTTTSCPYYVRVGDSWTKIDYAKQAEEWMKPLVRGEETDLIEIPASWYLDDLPPMMFIKTAPNSHGFVNPRRHRAALDGPVRLGLPRARLRGLHDDDPPRRQRAPGRAR